MHSTSFLACLEPKCRSRGIDLVLGEALRSSPDGQRLGYLAEISERPFERQVFETDVLQWCCNIPDKVFQRNALNSHHLNQGKKIWHVLEGGSTVAAKSTFPIRQKSPITCKASFSRQRRNTTPQNKTAKKIIIRSCVQLEYCCPGSNRRP